MTLSNVAEWAQPFFFVYIVTLFLSYAGLFFGALRPFWVRTQNGDSWAELTKDPTQWPPVTVILPAYNEEAVIVDCVNTMLRVDYPALEVIVVCDGPKDSTFEALVEAFSLQDCSLDVREDFVTKPLQRVMTAPRYPGLRVILKENGGKADALNVGLNAARTPLVCCCDADTLIEPMALRRMVRPFQEDPSTVATSGALMLTNGARFEKGLPVQVRAPRNWWAAVQVVEYTRAFYLGRMGFDTISSMLIISGAFGLFDRHALVAVGGYNHATVGEDMELVVRLHRHFRLQNRPYSVQYVPSAVAWTEAPESLKMLRSQRMRWQRGLCEVLSMHRGMPFQKRAGMPGIVGGLYFFFFEALAPLFELAGYLLFVALLAFGYRSWNAWAAMLALALSFLSVVTLASLLVQQLYAPVVHRPKDLGKLLLASTLEMLFFKPLTSWWRAHATFSFLKGRPARWDPIKRKGFNARGWGNNPPTASAPATTGTAS